VEKVAVDKAVIRQARDLLEKAAEDRDSAMEKLAATTLENVILLGTLELIEQGLVDPADATSKLAEFRDDPEQIEFIKKASAFGVYRGIGSLTNDDFEFDPDSTNSEEKFVDNLRQI
jgi:hypothetical protein